MLDQDEPHVGPGLGSGSLDQALAPCTGPGSLYPYCTPRHTRTAAPTHARHAQPWYTSHMAELTVLRCHRCTGGTSLRRGGRTSRESGQPG